MTDTNGTVANYTPVEAQPSNRSDRQSTTGPKSLEEGSSWISYLLMTYLDVLFAKGNVKTLELDDLGGIPKGNRSELLYKNFRGHYARQLEFPPAKRSLWHALWMTVGYWRVFFALILFGLSAAIQLGPVLILTELVQHFEGTKALNNKQLWVLVALLFVFPMLTSITLAHSNAIMAHIGCQFRNTLINVIYRKSLTISSYRRQGISTGRILTMFSDDTNQIRNFLFFMPNALMAPLQIGACLYLIYQQVGAAVFVGLAYSVFTVPISGFVFRMVFTLRRQKMTFTDARVKLMNEVLNGIRIIKYYAWESAFVAKIDSVRREEIRLLQIMGYAFNVVFALLMLGAPQTQTVLIFLTYIGLGNTLDAAKAFTTLTLFGIMTSPFIFLPFGLQMYSQCTVSMRRIIEYIDSEDIVPYIDYKSSINNNNPNNSTGLPASTPADSSPAIPSPQPSPSKPGQRLSKRDSRWLDTALVLRFTGCDLAWTPLNEAELRAEDEAAKKNSQGTAAGQTFGGAKAGAKDAKGKPGYQAVAAKEGDNKEGKDLEAVAVVEEALTAAPANNGPNRAIHTLVGLNLTVKKGQLVGIVGSVGSGKSSLLNALLGEMHLKGGTIEMLGGSGGDGNKALSFAFCDQRPWIVNATVKENILFGRDYDETRFHHALFVAAMEDDLKILPGGVLTEIGERGINLSGGQKARVALARAVYQDADVYLLDDPLSAVDAHVGEHIFHRCIQEALRDKTVLLVTHHLHVLPSCDQLVILQDDGHLLIAGSYDEIQASGIDVTKYLKAKEEEGEWEGDDEEVDKEEARSAEETAVGSQKKGAEEGGSHGEESKRDRTRSGSRAGTGGSGTTPRSRMISSASAKMKKEEDKATKDKTKTEAGKLITKEEKNEGDVPWATYFSYISFGGVWAFFLTLATQLMCQGLQVEANFWLSAWGSQTIYDEYVHGQPMTRARSFYWFNGYAGMLMGSVGLLVISRALLTYHRTNASARFHERVLNRVLFFPISFFDITPIGRIINRFSQDMATIDEDLAQTMSQVISMVGAVLGGIGAIAGSTKGTFLILLVPLGYLYRLFNIYFRKSNTAIARLEAVSRSPIYADFSQTLSGTTTIRAYGQSDRFIHNLETYADTNTVPGVLQQIASQWLSIRLDFLGSLVMFFMGALTVSSANVNFIPAGYLGLGLSYAIQLTSLLKMAVRVTATMEAQFNAVERIRHYALMIKVEEEDDTGVAGGEVGGKGAVVAVPAKEGGGAIGGAPKLMAVSSGGGEGGDIEMGSASPLARVPKGAPIIPGKDWPGQGVVVFEDVVMRYRDGPLVLKGVSFAVQSFEKIGIAGRTGCGKSSLMVALFRIEELVSGRILIDGLDIARIPLPLLRSKLCIIPQDPVMFSASVRFNLDPFNEYNDGQVWEVLRDVNMKEHIMSLPNQLDEMVAEGGDNFSAGQRQLICIGRAILRKPKILVMDEATASIDAKTDAFIQRMIRSKFLHCTVLTIAHRLHTIIDNTKILVLDAGLMAEFDTPATLLGKEKGDFKSLWERHVSEGGMTAVDAAKQLLLQEEDGEKVVNKGKLEEEKKGE